MSHYPFIARCLLLAFVCMYGTAASAQAFVESEPNDACLAAQNIGVFPQPSTVFGSLDSTPEAPDVDFFVFEADPGQRLQVDLEGSSTGAGSLGDPFLGLFNADCGPLALDDDSGDGLNSRLVFDVPGDGRFVIGVTNCCDGSFIGGGVGSYLLTLSQFMAIDSISGRLINAATGNPLPGSDFPYANVQLFRCNADGCFEFISYQPADSEGRFLFNTDQFGSPLSVGTYQIQANANGFELLIDAPFFVTDSEARDLGDLALVPLQLIGSVTGRLVDAFSGRPLPGNIPPFAFVTLQRCEEFGCFDVAGAVPDEFGRFSFDGPSYLIGPGTFQLYGRAEDYRDSTSARFTVDAVEDVDIGDFTLTPFPIQFGAIQPCEIPYGGGACEYGIEVTYQGEDRRFRGKAWSIVEFYAPPSFRLNRFQVGRGGAEHPRPENVFLRRGGSATVSFHLDVPPSVPDGSTVCGYITVGQAPDPQFNSQGDRFIFCSVKQSDGLIAMPEKEGRKRLEELKDRGRGLDERRQRRSEARPDRGSNERLPR